MAPGELCKVKIYAANSSYFVAEGIAAFTFYSELYKIVKFN